MDPGVGYHLNYVYSTLPCSGPSNHWIDLITYIIYHGTTYLPKYLKGNGPVAGETACSSSKGGMTEQAGWWEQIPDLVYVNDGKCHAQHWWEGMHPDVDKGMVTNHDNTQRGQYPEYFEIKPYIIYAPTHLKLLRPPNPFLKQPNIWPFLKRPKNHLYMPQFTVNYTGHQINSWADKNSGGQNYSVWYAIVMLFQPRVIFWVHIGCQ